ncbi:MAG: AmmeMemoRadiSam system protein B [bacterium]
MICFYSLVPYSPLMLPSFKSTHSGKISGTAKALNKLAEELYLSKPDIVVVVADSDPDQPNTLINQSPKLSLDFSPLGDFQTTVQYTGESLLTYQFRERLETNYPSQIIHEEKLSYRYGLPLLALLKHLPNVQLIPITVGQQDPATIIKMGEQLRQALDSTAKRVAVIAIGVLSQTLKKKSPAGYVAEAKEYDHLVIDIIKTMDEKRLVEIGQELRKKVSENLYSPLLFLFGVIDRSNVRSEVLAYEDTLGVGYLTVKFELA